VWAAAGDRVEQSGLPGAVRADEGDPLRAAYRELADLKHGPSGWHLRRGQVNANAVAVADRRPGLGQADYLAYLARRGNIALDVGRGLRQGGVVGRVETHDEAVDLVTGARQLVELMYEWLDPRPEFRCPVGWDPGVPDERT
jgi:hypothetical protein